LNIKKKKRSVERHKADELEYLLDHFTIQQILDLAAAVSPHSEFDKAKSKPELLQKLKTVADVKRLTLAAHRLETLLPFKHMYLLKFEKSKPSTQFSSLRSLLTQKWATLLSTVKPVNLSVRELQVQCALIDESNHRIYIKLCHPVRHFDWVDVDQNNRERLEYISRHPVIFCLRADDSVATVSFPGFSQGSGTPETERIAYSFICENAREVMTSMTGLAFQGLEIKAAVDRLINEKYPEVVNVQRNIQLGDGSASVNAGETGSDVGIFLSKMIGMKVPAAEIRLLLSQEESKSIALFWKNTRHFTRIKLEDSAPEILFIWKEAGASVSAVEHTLTRLMQAVPLKAHESEVYELIQKLPVGERVWTSQLMQKFGLDEEAVLRLLSDAVRESSLVPRFRVKSDAILLGYANEWRSSWTELPERVEDENGKEIIPSKPDQVEVVYERVAK
jgi:hypothetical protein